MDTFHSVRDRASRFVIERDWNKFHTPINLALALSGECGEISEIFQWKGPLDNDCTTFTELTTEDIQNAGEEIADVFIYSTRLSDVCKLNLANCVNIYINSNGSNQKFVEYSNNNFVELSINSSTDLKFSDLNIFITKNNPLLSSRYCALSIQKCSGDICNLFVNKNELSSYPNIDKWPRHEVIQLGYSLATICYILAALSVSLKLNIGTCIANKFIKNEKKYPTDLVKGSSAKYTAYADIVARRGNIIDFLRNTKVSLIYNILLLGLVTAISFILFKHK